MPAAFRTGSITAVNDGGSSTQSTGNITTQTGDVIYVLVGCSATTPQNVNSVVWDASGVNEAFTRIAGPTNLGSGSTGRVEVWRLAAPTAKTAVITATWAAAVTERVLAVWIGSGISTSNPNGTPATQTGTDTAWTTGAITTTSGQLVLGLGFYHHQTATAIAFNSPSGTERHEATTSPDPYDGAATQDQSATGGSTTLTWTLSSSPGTNNGAWYAFGAALNDGDVVTQAAYRFYNDDGSESGSTPMAAQNANVSAPAGGVVRLRFGLQATGDPAAAAYQVDWRPVGGGNWERAEV